MDSDSSPIVIIDRYTHPGRYWDVSPIITSLNYTYGRNQPFAVAEVVVKKSYFNSADMYWNGVSNVPKVNGIAVIPKIKSGITPVTIILYGETYEFIIEKYNSDDDYITLLCYNKAYKLKNQIEFQSICKFKSEEGEYYFEGDDANPLSKEITEEGKIILSYEVDIIDRTPQVVKFHITDKSSAPVEGEVIGKGEITTNYIEATGTNLFKFIVNKALGISPVGCVCDKGYSYYSFESEVEDAYTESEIEYVKEETPTASEEEQVLKLRARDIDCWDIINSIGMLSNRWAFFHDKAYFVDYNSPQCNVYNDMQLDYGVNDEGEALSYYSYTDGESEVKNSLDIYQIVDNIDQGSKHVMSSQTVYSENHSATVRIIDAEREISGDDIYFPLIEDEFDNSIRNRITKELAFNRLVSNFRPLDCIEFTISEMVAPVREFTHDADSVASRVTDLPTGKPNGTIGLVVDGIFSTYYIYDSIESEWIVYESHKTSRNRRNELFPIYSKISTIRDIQNNITMDDVSLSRTQFSFPSCVTTLTFGNPEFSDALSQLSDLEKGVDTSTTKGTEDVLISDRYASKIVVGNQTLSALRDGREGFTGLIMEKNRDNELYRLSGYNKGELQAYFNSQGEIMSGNGKVKINKDGITIGAGAGEIDPSITSVKIWNSSKTYVSGEIVKWNDITYLSLVDGNIDNVPGVSDKWQQLTYNTSAVQVWVAGTYKDGQTVIYDGVIYESLIDDNTATPGSDDTKWKQLTYDNASIGKWDEDATYRLGEVIIYKNIMYRSISDANTNNIPASSTTKWEQLTYEDSSVKTWVQGTYDLGQIVLHDNVTYISTASGNTSKPRESSTWQQLTYINTETYDSEVTYSKGQFVLVGGDTYVSLQDGNKGHTPASSPTYWSLLTYSDFYVIEWVTGMACDVGQLVLYGGKTYVATAITAASDEPGVSDKWQQLTATALEWNGATSYKVGDIVTYDKLLYIALTANNSKIPKTNTGDWKQTVNTGDLSGEISASDNKIKGGTTVIDGDGLKTYKKTDVNQTNPVCTVDTDGNITGITITADKITGGTLDISNGAVKIDGNGLYLNKGGVLLNENGLSVGEGLVKLDTEGVTVMYNPSSDIYISQDALKFRRNDSQQDTLKIYSRKYRQDDAFDKVINSGVANIISCERPIGNEYAGPNYDTYLRIYAKQGYYNIPNKQVTLRTESNIPNNYKPPYMSTSSTTYKSDGSLVSSYGIYPSYSNFHKDTFTTNNWNQPMPSGSVYAIVEYTIGNPSNLIPTQNLPGEGGWELSFDYQAIINTNYSDYVDIWVEYMTFNPGLGEHIGGDVGGTVHKSPIYTNKSYTVKNNIKIPLYGLMTSAYRKISIFAKGKNMTAHNGLFGPNFSIRNLKLNYYESERGGEVRFHEDSVKLYGSTKFMGMLDGTFGTTSFFRQSLRNSLAHIEKVLAPGPIEYNDSPSSEYFVDTWYSNPHDGMEFITYIRSEQNIELWARDANNVEYLIHYHSDAHHGNGHATASFLLPRGWSFKFKYGIRNILRFKIEVII